MACNTNLSSILKSCDNNIGGVTKFYIIPAEIVTGTTVASGSITTIGLSGATKFSEFEFNKNSASYTEEAAISFENGSTFYTTTVTLTIPRREKAKQIALALIAAGQRNLKIIVKDGNGLYWFVGFANDANLSGLADGSGAAKGDGSKYVLTFIAEEPQLMYEVDSAIMSGLI
jgi:hypothetical protein